MIYWIALAALLVTGPFTVNNIVHQRTGLAVASIVVVLVLVVNIWSSRQRSHGAGVVMVTLVPASIAFLAFCIHQQGIIGLLWCFPAILSFYCMMPQRMAMLANLALLAVELPLLALWIDPALAARGAATLFGTSLFAAIQLRLITDEQAELSERVVTDPLTGLLNRHALAPTLDRAIERAGRDDTSAALLLIDLDRFKTINDEHGHEVGDDVLREVGALLAREARPGDAAFRLGGDEFLVVLHGADEAESVRVAEETRRAIRAADLLAGRTVTASVGHAVLGAADERRAWMRRADSALYRAKAGGRDRAVGDSSGGT